MKQINCLCDQMEALSKKLSWLPVLLMRLSLGYLFLTTGWAKAHNLARVSAYFVSLNLPHPHFTAIIVASTELICGSLLLLGLLARFASIPLMISMTVAILTARRSEISGLSDLIMLTEYGFILMLFTITILGAGPVSMDSLLWKKLKPRLLAG